MKKLFTILVLFCVICTLHSQSLIINKQIKDFPDVYDLSTPLNAGVTMYYFMINGTDNLWRDASVSMYRIGKQNDEISNKKVSKKNKTQLLNDSIKEVLIYKDSAACMITKMSNTRYYRVRNLVFENGKWVNLGEDIRSSIEESIQLFYKYVDISLSELHRSYKIREVSTDTLAFVNYVSQQGNEPKEFLLNALAKHPLVIYGEIHRRKVSWDLLSTALQDPRFAETVGTIFLEIPAYQQEEFDRFYTSKELDTEILLDIMRSEQIYGWWDKGEYEFLVNLWKLNKTLPVEKKIRVVPTDDQLPWKLIQTKEDLKKWKEKSMDRNTRMADVVEHTIKTKTDKRNSLFIVGYGHAYKSHVPGGYSSTEEQEPLLSAGAQLVQRFSNKDVFTILQHGPCLHNTRGGMELVRQGLFDYVFEKNGNKPIAFSLAGSPFGTEPYDADSKDRFDHRAGNYADNFDGYIFLQPLKDEDTDYILYGEIWTDKFVKEVQRRYALFNWDMKKDFGIKGKLSKEKIIKSFKDGKRKKRWGYLFE